MLAYILIVEDDFLNRRFLKNILIDEGYVVYEAQNVEQAITILNKNVVNLVILDIDLGVDHENGVRLGHLIKEKYHLPFIYLTSYSAAHIVNEALMSAPISYLTKPFKKVDLIISLKLALQQGKKDANTPSISVKDGIYHLDLQVDKIDYIESKKNYLIIWSEKSSYKYRSTIKDILLELPDSQFIQTHRAFIVNQEKIKKFNQKYVQVGQLQIPISKTYLGTIRRLLQ